MDALIGMGLLLFFCLLMWLGVRLVRWAKRGSKAASLLGLGMGLPAAGANPMPPPREQIEEVVNDIQARRNSNAADSEK